MNFSRLRKLSLIVSLLLLPSVGTADPIDPTAKWLGPWLPTLNPIVKSSGFGGDASGFRSFPIVGAAGSLPDTSARAFSRATADSATIGGGSATTGVNFNRTFQLNGSPAGWDVKLSGRLVGFLFTASPTAPSATVQANALIGGGPTLNWGPITLLPNRQRLINEPMDGTTILADGTYTVTGFLTTSASVGPTFNPFSSGAARSDFASQDRDGFYVGVDATPHTTPEPSTLILLGTGLITLSRLCFLRNGKTTN